MNEISGSLVLLVRGQLSDLCLVCFLQRYLFVCPILLGQVEIRQNGQMALAAMVETTKSQSTKIVYEVGDRPPGSKSKMSSPSCSLPATGAASFPSSAFPARALCPARNSPRGPYAAATTLLSPSLPFGHFPSGFNQTP